MVRSFNNDFNDVTGCPDLLVGENCTENWKQSLEPGSTIVQIIVIGGLVPVFSYVSVMLLDVLKNITNNDSGDQDGLLLRLRIMASGWCALFFTMLLYIFGMNMEYRFDDWRGIVCVSSLLFGTAFILQTAMFMLAMYVRILGNKVKQGGYPEVLRHYLDSKLIDYVAVPWPQHISNIILIVLASTGFITSPLFVVKLAYGMLVLYPMIPVVYLQRFYFLGLADSLEKMLNNPTMITANETRAAFKGLAQDSKLIGYYAIYSASWFILLLLASIIADAFRFPIFYLVFQSMNGIGLLTCILIFTLVLRPGRWKMQSSKNATAMTSEQLPSKIPNGALNQQTSITNNNLSDQL